MKFYLGGDTLSIGYITQQSAMGWSRRDSETLPIFTLPNLGLKRERFNNKKEVLFTSSTTKVRYSDIMAPPKLSTEIVTKYADKYRELASQRHKIQFIDTVPVFSSTKKCMARLMNGKVCPYVPLKCTSYCKRHTT